MSASDAEGKVLAHLRGYVGHEGGQYATPIRRACGLSQKAFADAVDGLIEQQLVRSWDDPRGKLFAPMPW